MSGQNQKFNSSDRRKVKEFYEKINLGIKLAGVDRKEKYLQDQTNRKYCLLGALEDSYHWHGIDEKIINDEKWKDAILIIAIRHKDVIRIYQGLLSEIICNKDRLALVKSTPSVVSFKKLQEDFAAMTPEQQASLIEALEDGGSNSIATTVSGYSPDKAIRKQYQFNTVEKEDRLVVKEIPSYSLKKIGTASL